MFPSCSPRTVVERKARKKTGCDAAHPARKSGFTLRLRKRQQVRRIGAFSWQHTKKQPWDEAIAAELAFLLSGQSGSRKETGRLTSGLVLGVSPAPRKGWLLADADIRASVPRPEIFAGAETRVKLADHGQKGFKVLQKVGATTDPRYGCSVNRTESGNRLVRFTKALFRVGVALTGGDACA